MRPTEPCPNGRCVRERNYFYGFKPVSLGVIDYTETDDQNSLFVETVCELEKPEDRWRTLFI